MDVRSLAAEGVSTREVARRTGLSRNTVRTVTNFDRKLIGDWDGEGAFGSTLQIADVGR